MRIGMGLALWRAQRDRAPVAVIVLLDEVLGPAGGFDRDEIGGEPVRLERERQPQAVGEAGGHSRFLRHFGARANPEIPEKRILRLHMGSGPGVFTPSRNDRALDYFAHTRVTCPILRRGRASPLW